MLVEKDKATMRKREKIAYWALSSEGVEKSSGGVEGSVGVKKKKFYPI